MHNLIKLFIKYCYWNGHSQIYQGNYKQMIANGGLDYIFNYKLNLYSKENEFICSPNSWKIADLIKKYING